MVGTDHVDYSQFAAAADRLFLNQSRPLFSITAWTLELTFKNYKPGTASLELWSYISTQLMRCFSFYFKASHRERRRNWTTFKPPDSYKIDSQSTKAGFVLDEIPLLDSSSRLKVRTLWHFACLVFSHFVGSRSASLTIFYTAVLGRNSFESTAGVASWLLSNIRFCSHILCHTAELGERFPW